MWYAVQRLSKVKSEKSLSHEMIWSYLERELLGEKMVEWKGELIGWLEKFDATSNVFCYNLQRSHVCLSV